MEAAVVNLVAPGSSVLVASGGKFGDRWISLLESYGITPQVVRAEWGAALDCSAIERALERDPSIGTVFTTHSETSTGAIHDVEAMARITRPRDVRLVVDGITSVGVHPLLQDTWGVDVVVCGSQKGLMCPPGIATLSLAPWAAAAIEGDRLPRFYFDLRRARKSAPIGETPFTPAVSLVLALEEALAMIREEGLEEVYRRHRRVALAARAGAVALGFRLFSTSPSHALTALFPPEGIDASAVVKRLREHHGMVVAGGQDHLKGKIFRIGHMGAYDLADVHAVLGALEECVATLGGRGNEALSGRAAVAARAAWQEA
jgi:aspartate aminotransferase-like enzyme